MKKDIKVRHLLTFAKIILNLYKNYQHHLNILKIIIYIYFSKVYCVLILFLQFPK